MALFGATGSVMKVRMQEQRDSWSVVALYIRGVKVAGRNSRMRCELQEEREMRYELTCYVLRVVPALAFQHVTRNLFNPQHSLQ